MSLATVGRILAGRTYRDALPAGDGLAEVPEEVPPATPSVPEPGPVPQQWADPPGNRNRNRLGVTTRGARPGHAAGPRAARDRPAAGHPGAHRVGGRADQPEGQSARSPPHHKLDGQGPLIRELRAAGWPWSAIGRRLGVSAWMVQARRSVASD